MEARFAAGEALRGNRAAALQVDLANEGDPFEGEIRFRPRGDKTVRALPVSLPSKSRKRYFLPFFAGFTGPLNGDIELVDQTGRPTAASRPLSGTVSGSHCVIGIVGRERDPGIKNLLARKPWRYLNTVHAFSAEDMPDLWEGLAPYDVLFVWGTDGASFTALQRAALRDWVMRGGVLLAVADGDGTYWDGSFVDAALDLELGSRREEKTSERLWAYTRKEGVGRPDRFFRVEARARRGETKVFQGTGFLDDLLCIAPLGRGWVAFVAFDPDQPGIRSWAGLPHVWARFFGSWLSVQREGEGEPDWTDAEEWITRSMQRQVAPLPSVLFVVLAVIAYGLVIGPLEYLAWRFLRRPNWTLVSFPLLVALAGGAALWVTSRVKGREVTQTEVTVEDIEPTTGDSVWDSYMALYSPSPSLFELRVEGKGYAAEILHRRATLSGKQDRPCTFGPEGLLRARVQVGGLRYFRSAGLAAGDGNPLRVQIRKTEFLGPNAYTDRVEYTVEIQNRLDRALTGCAVVSGEMHRLGPSVLLLVGGVPPGGTAVFSTEARTVRRVGLDSYLQSLEQRWDGGEYDPRTAFPYLSFFYPEPGKSYKWMRRRRGLHVGDRLRHEDTAFFTAWSEDEPLVFTAPGWEPQAALRLRWFRVPLERGALETETKQLD